jgi:hypothetical protein
MESQKSGYEEESRPEKGARELVKEKKQIFSELIHSAFEVSQKDREKYLDVFLNILLKMALR